MRMRRVQDYDCIFWLFCGKDQCLARCTSGLSAEKANASPDRLDAESTGVRRGHTPLWDMNRKGHMTHERARHCRLGIGSRCGSDVRLGPASVAAASGPRLRQGEGPVFWREGEVWAAAAEQAGGAATAGSPGGGAGPATGPRPATRATVGGGKGE